MLLNSHPPRCSLNLRQQTGASRPRLHNICFRSRERPSYPPRRAPRRTCILILARPLDSSRIVRSHPPFGLRPSWKTRGRPTGPRRADYRAAARIASSPGNARACSRCQPPLRNKPASAPRDSRSSFAALFHEFLDEMISSLATNHLYATRVIESLGLRVPLRFFEFAREHFDDSSPSAANSLDP